MNADVAAGAFALAANLQGLGWNRPMTYEVNAALMRNLGGRVPEGRMDRILAGAPTGRTL